MYTVKKVSMISGGIELNETSKIVGQYITLQAAQDKMIDCMRRLEGWFYEHLQNDINPYHGYSYSSINLQFGDFKVLKQFFILDEDGKQAGYVPPEDKNHTITTTLILRNYDNLFLPPLIIKKTSHRMTENEALMTMTDMFLDAQDLYKSPIKDVYKGDYYSSFTTNCDLYYAFYTFTVETI